MRNSPSFPLKFDKSLKERIAANTRHFKVRSSAHKDLRRAAVSVVVVRSDRDPAANQIPWSTAQSGDAAIVLTRRAAGLNRHAGQWALPGGRVDCGETATSAALRELEEEIGLNLDETDIIARLDDYPTRSGFVITPFVLWAGEDHELIANPGEVASIHRIPIREFLRGDAPMLEARDNPARPVLRMPVGNSWIAAPTAAVVYQFVELAIKGYPLRVDHFEQPEFAWR